jgi:hypothetical protein
MIRTILAAAVHKPWEDEDDESPVIGKGAPEEFEFRVHPEGGRIAVWAPAVGHWVVFADVMVLDTAPLMTDKFDHWHQFLEVELYLEP